MKNESSLSPALSLKGEGEVVAVIGAGPIGLAAAANLLERGYQPIVFEAGPSVAASHAECSGSASSPSGRRPAER